MGKLHELLAVEKTKTNASKKLIEETNAKFKKVESYFQGYNKTLNMLEDSPANKAIEESAAEERLLTTTVYETLKYTLDLWAKAEDVQYQKSLSNQVASGTVMYNGKPILTDIPVDELLGLETRLTELRRLFSAMPTLPSANKWVVNNFSDKKGAWVTPEPETTTKTEKTTIPVVLYEATDKHPAQVKESTTDKIVGKFSVTRHNGSASSAQKAEAITIIDELLSEVKQARMRANATEAKTDKMADTIVRLIMSPFED